MTVHIVQINYAFDRDLTDPEALLARYATLTQWSEALTASGASRVTVVQRFCRHARLERNGIDYIFHDDGRGAQPGPWTWPARLHRAAAEGGPDVAHVNGLIFPVQTWMLRRVLAARSAIVMQDHASRAPDTRGAFAASPLARELRRRGLRAADAFWFAAAQQADAWRQAGLIAIDQPVYQVMEASTTLRGMPRAAARQTSGVDGTPALLWVGRLNANKDPLTVLEGFERALARLPDATLTMVFAADDLLPQVRARVTRSSALASRVRLVGRVPHHGLPAFYSAADMFVLGSHHEGSGYALIEALACGLMPVVTDIPTFRVLTADGSLGVLWAPGDAWGLADALVDAGQRDLTSCREKIARHFDRELSWPAVGRQAMAAYADVVKSRQARLCDRRPP